MSVQPMPIVTARSTPSSSIAAIRSSAVANGALGSANSAPNVASRSAHRARSRSSHSGKMCVWKSVTATARRYCAGRGFTLPDLALANARAVLRLFFDRHVLRRRSIFGSLHEAFRRAAAEAGFADDSGDHRRQRARREEPAVPRTAVDLARRAMGLGSGPLTARGLKARYKELMKRFHPDVNPRGLQRCQEINAAYATLSELAVAG